MNRTNKVLKLGGHILFSTQDSFEKYCKTLDEAFRISKVHIVVGGGNKAREYINLARKLGLSETVLDDIGIRVSQINAYIMFNYLSRNHRVKFAKNLEELLEGLNEGASLICGGLFPSISTTTVACLLAELCSGSLYYATDVAGVYDKDPKLYKDAKLLEKISFEELYSIMSGSQNFKAGEYKLFDYHSLEIIRRSKITVRVFDGSNPENIIRVLKNENIGTLIYHK